MGFLLCGRKADIGLISDVTVDIISRTKAMQNIQMRDVTNSKLLVCKYLWYNQSVGHLKLVSKSQHDNLVEVTKGDCVISLAFVT